MKSYPLFVPPDELGGKTPREWSSEEAKTYYSWLLGVLDKRVGDLLAYFGEELTGEAKADLQRLGERVAIAVVAPQFSFQSEAAPIEFKRGASTFVAPPVIETEVKLTDGGYALAADMGLLVAKLLLNARPSKVKWTILKKPKNDASYQMPVLTGFGKLFLEPVGGSVAETYGVLRRQSGPEAWSETFDTWRKMVR
jgi:hypothetical protein